MSAALRAWLLGGAAIALVGAGIAGYLITQTRERSLPPLPTSNVPATFRDLQKGWGHSLHVAQEGIACAECHDVEHAFAVRGARACAKCHEPQASMQHALHTEHAITATLSDCLSCHGFDADPADHRWDCMRCHEQPQGALAAVSRHAQQDCSTCHHPHDDPEITPSACLSCHPASKNEHAARATTTAPGLPLAGHGAAGAAAQPGPAANCLQCHRAHDESVHAADRCLDCHTDKPHALFTGHDTCTSCHVPHGFSTAEVATCRGCHQSQHVLAEERVPAHRICTNCHRPHQVALQAPPRSAGAAPLTAPPRSAGTVPPKVGDATCQGCHTSVAPTHPSVEGHSCTSCHQPHASAANSAHVPPVQPCTSCHDLAKTDQGAHGGHAACTQCHVPHAFAHPAQPGACTECHQTQLTQIASNPGHTSCLGCHRGHPHDAELPPKACAECHASVHPRKEHAQCLECHEPHSGAPRPLAQSCAHCHAQEQHSTATVHTDCLTCHSPHTGDKLPAAQCKSCHSVQAKQNHGDLAAGCTKCHGVHADAGLLATPTCTSCHAIASLPGLHAQPAHQKCATCHQGAHDPGPFSARATCITCHQKQREHVPDAALCQGCHVFRQ